jgi:hypothetical protein
MSILHKPAIARLEELLDLKELAETLAEDAEESGQEVGQVVLTLISEEDEFVDGTYVPELWLVVRKVLPE